MAKPTVKSTNLVSYQFVTVITSLDNLLSLFPNSHDLDYSEDDGHAYDVFILETENGDVFKLYNIYTYVSKEDNTEWKIAAHSRDIALQAGSELNNLIFNL